MLRSDWQGGLHPELALLLPYAAEASEGAAVGKASLGEPFVRALDAHWRGVHRGPSGERGLRARRERRTEHASSVQRPRRRAARISSVEGDGASTLRVGCPDPDLELDHAAFWDFQRTVESQFLDRCA